MNHNSAQNLLAEFYQVFWNMIKEYLMALFEDFHRGVIPLHSINFGTITLLKEVAMQNKFNNTDIHLLNVSFKKV